VRQEEQQATPQDLQSLQSKITTEDATTYRDFTANEGQQNVEIRPKVNGFIQKYMLTKGKRSEKDKFFSN
jgi:membrane fusion protein (multidrug efflux system)